MATEAKGTNGSRVMDAFTRKREQSQETIAMKKLCGVCAVIFLVALMCATSGSAATKDISLVWDANTEADIAGYRIHQGRAVGGPYVKVAEVAHPLSTATLTIIEDGLYSWVATAFDTSGNESGFSNEVTFSLDTVAPAAPAGFRLAP